MYLRKNKKAKKTEFKYHKKYLNTCLIFEYLVVALMHAAKDQGRVPVCLLPALLCQMNCPPVKGHCTNLIYCY